MTLTPLKLYATIALFAILVITGGGLLARIDVLKLQVSTLQKDAALEGQRTAEAVTKAVQAERDLETARQAAQQKVIDDAANQHLKDVADATTARTERDRLRAAAKAYASAHRAASGDSALVAPGAATPDALDVLVGVLGRVDDAAGTLASYADDLSTSLNACIGSYVALTPAATVTESTSP